MAIRLEKGQRINLEKSDGRLLRQFCVGANWGAITTRSFWGRVKVLPVDLDLSCVMLDQAGKIVDHIYSPLYNIEVLRRMGFPPGKLRSVGNALCHSGDDLEGDTDGDDGLDNEIITVDLDRVANNVAQIFFFLNNVRGEDFSQIPHASIRMYEGTPKQVREVFATYDLVSDQRYKEKRAVILGKLYCEGSQWHFAALGEVTSDANFMETIARILKHYARG